MNDFARIMLVLSKDEFLALKNSAQREYRHPREQARYILRTVLFGEQATEDKKSDAPTYQGRRVAIEA